MKKIKNLIALAILSILFINILPAKAAINEVYVGNATTNPVYTLSETEYDEETGKLAYQKISYSKNTYNTTLCTELDASGASVEVSNDAQYIFFPARYLNITEETVVSFKYKNTGVERIYLHAEYYAGVNQGGVDYDGGYKFVCVNAISSLDAWNVTESKSVDGYDVTSVLFGNYAKEIYDFTLIGFRLYFDYGLTVSDERTFEVFGYEVHEANNVPTFTTDPKPTRLSKLSSEDVVIKNNTFTVEDNATVSAKVYDYTTENYKLSINFNLSDKALIDFKLDGQSVLSKQYGKGDHTVYIELTEDEYSLVEMVFTATNTVVKIKSMNFLAPATVDVFSGSAYDISANEGVITVKYSYQNAWNHLTAAIRNYNEDYEYLRLKFNLSHPIIVGVYIDDVAVRSHWSYKDPLAQGDHELLIDLSEVDIDSTSNLLIYLDPPVDSDCGVAAEKTVVFNEVKLLKADDLPKAEITVDSSFEFDYDGNAHDVSGVTTDSLLPLVYEYKLEDASDETYTTDKPVNAGVYTVRITSPFNITEDRIYGKTYAYSKIIINKSSVNKPSVDSINIDYTNSILTYDSSVFVVGLDENYTEIIESGSYITCGTKLYFKYIESLNYSESESTTIELNDKEEVFNVTIDYLNESTKESIPSTVEYSKDGLNWTSGSGEVVKLEAACIYVFRTKATSSSFASDKTYLEVPARPEINVSLEIEKTNITSVTVKAVNDAEYRLADTDWQDSNKFTGLTAGKYVEIYMRIKSTETCLASEEVGVKVLPGAINTVEPIVKEPVLEEENQQNSDTTVTPAVPEDDVLPENTHVVTTYAELKQAANGSNNYLTTIIVKGSIALEGDLTIKGKVTLLGEDGAEIVFEKDTKKMTIYNSKNSEIKFENIKLTRTVLDTTEGYLFRFNDNGSVWFVDVEFNVSVTAGGADLGVDRITYVPSGPDVTIHFDNCVYNTEGYFYRGTMIFYNTNIEELPATGGSPTIGDFRGFKIDYLTKTFTIPAKCKVSTDSEFSELLYSGDTFESNTKYYITNGDVTFTYTTKDLKLATPTLNSVNVDYANETISFESQYLVSKNADFTDLVTSGDKVAPGMKLYIKELATGIYMDSDVFEVTLPERPDVVELECEFVCSFGFAMEYYPNAEYKIDDEYQLAPIFIGLESGKTYTVTIRIAATDNSFASTTYQMEVTLTN